MGLVVKVNGIGVGSSTSAQADLVNLFPPLFCTHSGYLYLTLDEVSYCQPFKMLR